MALAHLGQLGPSRIGTLSHLTNNTSVLPSETTYYRPDTILNTFLPHSNITSYSFRSAASSAYNHLKDTYKDRVTEETKPEILESINTTISNFTQAQIEEFKKKLDVQFSKDVNCWYGILGITHENYGCDLRELIFNVNGEPSSPAAKALLDTFAQISSSLKRKKRKIHVLTDIDDTLYPNYGHKTYVPGSDTSWPQKVPYPGVKQFYKELHKLPNSTGYTTILSATPGFLKHSKINSDELKTILGRDFGFIQGIESKRRQLANLPSIIKNWWNKGNDRDSSFYSAIGDVKFNRFKQYAQIFPERDFIWIGDNGQADAIAGSKMLEEFGDRVKVFIHRVSEPVDGLDKRITYFDSYSGLAELFKNLNIFNPAQFNAVIRSAAKDCTEPNASEDNKKIHCSAVTVHTKSPEMGGSRNKKSKKSKKSRKPLKSKKSRKPIKSKKSRKSSK
jgi:hypothetical protein